MRCKDNSLYCGSTNNVEARAQKHNSGQGSAYVRSRGGGVIVYTEQFAEKSPALKREGEVKRWSKAKKELLINNSHD